jgi:hypothetical protein
MGLIASRATPMTRGPPCVSGRYSILRRAPMTHSRASLHLDKLPMELSRVDNRESVEFCDHLLLLRQGIVDV